MITESKVSEENKLVYRVQFRNTLIKPMYGLLLKCDEEEVIIRTSKNILHLNRDDVKFLKPTDRVFYKVKGDSNE